MERSDIEVFEILNTRFPKEGSKKIVNYLDIKQHKTMQDFKELFLTKEDKLDLITRMDSHFRWLVGILLTVSGIIIAVSKL
jgi:hypothetical protein